jgi:hypothetical protein
MPNWEGFRRRARVGLIFTTGLLRVQPRVAESISELVVTSSNLMNPSLQICLPNCVLRSLPMLADQ